MFNRDQQFLFFWCFSLSFAPKTKEGQGWEKPRKIAENTKECLPLPNPEKKKPGKTAENTQNTKEFPWLEKTKEI